MSSVGSKRRDDEVRTALQSGEAYPRFHIQDEAFYFDTVIRPYRDPQVVQSWSVGLDSTGGGTFGEWEINWRKLGGRLTMRIEAFADSFVAMNAIPGWWEAVSSFGDDGPSPTELREALTALGYVDETNRTPD